jgi:Flp pilus assembly protein TadG
MINPRLVIKLQSMRHRFAAARSGQIALTFALSLLPLMLAVGCGIDLSRVLMARTQLLEAVDATGLAVARSPTGDPTKMTREAQAYFYANYGTLNVGTLESLAVEPMPPVVAPGATVAASPGIRVDARVRVPMSFMALAGVNDLEVQASADIIREARALEMVLVLDTTASMAGTKMSTLLSAGEALARLVMVDPSVRLAVVPFAQYVNIGLANRSIPGVSVPADSTTCTTINRNVTTCTGTETYLGTCYRNVNPQPGTCYSDGVPYTCTTYTREAYPCTLTRNTGCTTTTQPTTSCTSQTWRGCVGSRPPPNNSSDLGFPGSSLPGLMNTTCGQPVTLLTTSVSTIATAIRALRASGNTYMPAGLQLGWHVLTPRIPFDQASPYSSDPPPKRVMMLMTDGINSLSLSGTGPWHNQSSRTAADQLTLTLCNNIKADGIELYTVALEVTDAATLSMLRTCASSPSNFFNADSSSKLLESFQAIAASVSNLRLSK